MKFEENVKVDTHYTADGTISNGTKNKNKFVVDEPHTEGQNTIDSFRITINSDGSPNLMLGTFGTTINSDGSPNLMLGNGSETYKVIVNDKNEPVELVEVIHFGSTPYNLQLKEAK